jgi:hypothetical protein
LERTELKTELGVNGSIPQEFLKALQRQRAATLLVYEECGVPPPVLPPIQKPERLHLKPPKPKQPCKPRQPRSRKPRQPRKKKQLHPKPHTPPPAQSVLGDQRAAMHASTRKLQELKQSWASSQLEYAKHHKELLDQRKQFMKMNNGT